MQICSHKTAQSFGNLQELLIQRNTVNTICLKRLEVANWIISNYVRPASRKCNILESTISTVIKSPNSKQDDFM